MTGRRLQEYAEVVSEACERPCLRCRETFKSRHYGERVCRRCKDTERSGDRVRRRGRKERAEV